MTDNDILIDVKALLDDNWIDSNTASKTPTVLDITSVKKFKLNFADGIFLSELIRVPEDNAAGGLSKRTATTVIIEFRSALSRVQFVLIRKEIRRILNANQIDPFSDSVYDVTDITEDTDMSSNLTNFWRGKIKFRLEQFNLIVP